MSYRVRFTRGAANDLRRLYQFQLKRDLAAAELALQLIGKAIEILHEFPFACRKSETDNPFLRELVISFGASGYVALFEIEDQQTVTILAVRHQFEDDYH